jgi:hypothetical protein
MGEPATRTIPPLPSISYSKTQDAAKMLVAEALEDYPPSPDFSMRANTVRFLVGMWFIQGSMSFPRGWVAIKDGIFWLNLRRSSL